MVAWTRARSAVAAGTVLTLIVVALLAGLLSRPHDAHHSAPSTTSTSATHPEIKSQAVAPSTAKKPTSDTSTITDTSTNNANSQAAAPVITTPVTTTTGTPEQQQPASTGGGLFDKFVQVSQGASKQQSESTLGTCYPTDGAGLESAVIGTACSVIVLTNSFRNDYKIRTMMVVSSPKIIMGNPIALPVLNSTNGIERMFDVVAGGSLDLRSVIVFPGVGRAYGTGNARIIITMGGAIRVQPGGAFVGWGIVFRTPRQTAAAFRRDLMAPLTRRRTFGGMVLVMGGTFTCMGCQVIRVAPYGSPDFNTIQFGNNFLVVTGSLVCIGCYQASMALFASSINVGNQGAVLGGFAMFVGGGVVGTGAAFAQWIAGGNNFVGGGVMVNIGCVDNGAFIALVRAGMAQYAVGAGVFVMIGQMEDRAWGVAACFGAGQTYAVGTGVMSIITSEYVGFQICLWQSLSGGSAYVGPGDMNIINSVYVTFGVTGYQGGVGMRNSVDCGILELIQTVGVAVMVVRVQALLGVEAYLGAGFMSNVQNYRLSIQLAQQTYGGHEYYCGPGAAVFINDKSYVYRLLNGRTSPYAWVAAGSGVAASYPADPANGLETWVTNRGYPVFVNRTTAYKINDGILYPTPKLNPIRKRLAQAGKFLPATPLKARRAQAPATTTVEVDEMANALIARPVPKMSAIALINSGMKSEQLVIPTRSAFGSLLHDTRRRQLLATTEGSSTDAANIFLGGLSPRNLANLWIKAQNQAQASGNGSRKIWDDYVYAGEGTDCLLCGMNPGPNERYIAPEGTPLDSDWGIAKANAGRRLAGAHGSCNVSEACVAGTDPATAFARAQAISPQSLPYRPSLLGVSSEPDSYLQWGDLVLFCNPKDPSEHCHVSADTVKAAAIKALSDVLNAPEGTTPDFKVSASSAAMHSFTSKHLDEDGTLAASSQNSGSYSDTCNGASSEFSVSFTTRDASIAETVRTLLSNWTTDATPLMREMGDLGLCGATFSSKGDMFLPNPKNDNAHGHYQRSFSKGRASLWPSVMVLASSELAPITTAVEGHTYSITLDHFKVGSQIDIHLVQGGALGSTVVASANIDVTGPISVDWTCPPPKAGASSRYYLLAKPTTLLGGGFAFSNAFTIIAPSRR